MALLESVFPDTRYLPTYSGKQLRLPDPEPSQIDLEDIAHGLAYQCCLNGQTRYFYSLAQHSMLVASLVPPQHRLAALLHDAAAAYCGDMTGPLRHLFPEFPLIEKRILASLGKRYSVSGFDAPAIKRAHQIAQATELRDLRFPSDDDWTPPSRSVPIPRRIEPLPPEEAKYQFTEMLNELMRKSPPEKSAVFQESERCLLADPALAPRQLPGRKSRSASAAAGMSRDWQAQPPLAAGKPQAAQDKPLGTLSKVIL